MAATHDRELADAAWRLALFCQASPSEMGDGTPVDLQAIVATVTEGARRLARAEALRDDARSVAVRRTLERDQAEAERDALARELAVVLAERDALRAGRTLR